MRKLILSLVAFLAISSLAYAEPLKIRLGHGTPPGVIAPLLYQKKDVMKHYGKSYVVELTYFQATSLALQAMAAKELDITYIAFSSLGNAILNGGLDLKVISDVSSWSSFGHQGPEFMVLGDSPIKTLADVKGKIVAVSARGTGFHYTLMANLKKAGLQEKTDYTVVEVSLPAMEAALRAKRADVVIGTPPFLNIMEAKGGVRRLFKPEDAMGNIQSVVHVARGDLLKENRAAVEDFLEDYIRGVQWFLDPANNKEAISITAAFMKRPPSAFEGWVYTKGDIYRSPTATPDINALQRNLDTVFDLGLMKQRVDVMPHIALEPLEMAKKRLATN